MRAVTLSPVLALPLLLGLTAGAAGCKKPRMTDVTAESVITEENDDGSIAWDIEPDGSIHATLKGPDGTALTKNISGTITWPGDVTDQERDLRLENGALVASGPPLQEGLNELDYSLEVDGKTWAGVLHVPTGGTRAIDEDARTASALPQIPAEKHGPNGGTIQYIGGEPVELVADQDTQEVRLYVLNRDFQVVDGGDRAIRLGYGADYSGVELLVREPGALYWVGPWYAGYNPYRVTVAMTFGGYTHVGIMGWRYGSAMRFGVGAPVAVGFVGVRGWAPSVSVRAGVGFGVVRCVRCRGRRRWAVPPVVATREVGGGRVGGGGRGEVGARGEVGVRGEVGRGEPPAHPAAAPPPAAHEAPRPPAGRPEQPERPAAAPRPEPAHPAAAPAARPPAAPARPAARPAPRPAPRKK